MKNPCKSTGTDAPVDASQGLSVAPAKPDRTNIGDPHEKVWEFSWFASCPHEDDYESDAA